MSPPDLAHSAHILLDVIGGDIIVFAGHELAYDPHLRVMYDGTGMAPSLRLITGDGEIELCGEAEITRVTEALKLGRRMAKSFGDPIPKRDWIKQQRRRP